MTTNAYVIQITRLLKTVQFTSDKNRARVAAGPDKNHISESFLRRLSYRRL